MRARLHTLIFAAALASAVPGRAGAQLIAASRAGLSQATPTHTAVNRAAARHRRTGWEIGAAFGAVAGVTFGYLLVVNYDDGRAVKMGTGRRAATLIGSAAIGAGIGALVQTIID